MRQQIVWRTSDINASPKLNLNLNQINNDTKPQNLCSDVAFSEFYISILRQISLKKESKELNLCMYFRGSREIPWKTLQPSASAPTSVCDTATCLITMARSTPN